MNNLNQVIFWIDKQPNHEGKFRAYLHCDLSTWGIGKTPQEAMSNLLGIIADVEPYNPSMKDRFWNWVRYWQGRL